jgi:hypothetical protein
MDHRTERSNPLVDNETWNSRFSTTCSPLNSHSLIFRTSFATYQTKVWLEVLRPRGDKRPAKVLQASPLLPPRNVQTLDFIATIGHTMERKLESNSPCHSLERHRGSVRVVCARRAGASHLRRVKTSLEV